MISTKFSELIGISVFSLAKACYIFEANFEGLC